MSGDRILRESLLIIGKCSTTENELWDFICKLNYWMTLLNRLDQTLEERQSICFQCVHKFIQNFSIYAKNNLYFVIFDKYCI